MGAQLFSEAQIDRSNSAHRSAFCYGLGMHSCPRPALDHALIQIVDAALAEAARKSGEWLVCRPGCSQCCIGVFPINQLDAVRLKTGLADLAKREPERAERILGRARGSVQRLASIFPGDSLTGTLAGDEAQLAAFADSELADREPCPVLDPDSGTCELYDFRPMTCRVFGPPVRSEEGLGVCELCFHGATAQQIASCEMKPDPDDLESALNEEAESTSGVSGNTVVAFCLLSQA
jgi:Fe-S-cluster containining protein